jgi:lysophospholipase L1-like esterase
MRALRDLLPAGAGLGMALLASACGGSGGGAAPVASVPVASAAASTPTPAPISTPTPTPSPAPEPDPPINTKSLNVMFIGGSITEGAYAITPDKSYTALLTAWLRTRYEQVGSHNLGVGGTGSEFGMYRLNHDLADFVPDLAFVEFTINDAGLPRPTSFAHVDAIIHKLRLRNPRVRIVYLAATDAAVDEAPRRAGRRVGFIEDSAALAEFEGLTFIDLSAGLWSRVIGGASISTYLVDGVHPTNAGHQLYYEAIRSILEPMLPLAVLPKSAGGKLISQSNLGTARLQSATAAVGCHIAKLALRYMESTLECGQGDSFTYRFNGTTLGTVRAFVRDGGRLSCTVDGESPKTFDFFDVYALTYSRSLGQIDYRGLALGSHLLSCSVSDGRISVPEGVSTGRRVDLGYFLVSDEMPVSLP